MKPFIIVTVTEERIPINYDMELPTDVRVGTLIDNIQEALLCYNPSLTSKLSVVALYCARLDRVLPKDKTLGELGIWSGDVLVLR